MNGDLARAELLLGEDALRRLALARVAVFGLGGVGSWAAEALVRAGVGHITLVDSDTVDVSNINRQLPATVDTVGRPKAEVLCERFSRIRPEADVRPVVRFYDEASDPEFNLGQYDVVIDAIDSVAAKAGLILSATGKGIPFFSSMGAAQRLDPGRVGVAEFWKVRGCPLARALRQRFKRSGRKPARKFKCVYSEEPPAGAPKGTSMTVTATFGLRLAALAIDTLISNNNPQTQ